MHNLLCVLDRRSNPNAICRCKKVDDLEIFLSKDILDEMAKQVAIEIDNQILDTFVNGTTYEFRVS